MDTNAFQVQEYLGVNYLQVVLSEAAWFDEISMKVIKEDCPDFLIPFQMITVNDIPALKYRLTYMTSLAYLDMKLNKREFLCLYSSLLDPFIKGGNWFLDYHYLCVDPAYVFISRDRTAAYYIYVPEISCKNSEEEILDFFKGILDMVTLTDDKDFQLRLYQYFNKGRVTLAELHAMVAEESRRTGGQAIQPSEDNGSQVIHSPTGRGSQVIQPPTGREQASGRPADSGPERGEEHIPGRTISGEESDGSQTGDKNKEKRGFLGFGKNKKETKEKKEKKETPVVSEEFSWDPDAEENDDEVMNVLFGKGGGIKARGKQAEEKSEKGKTCKDNNSKDDLSQKNSSKDYLTKEKKEKAKGKLGLFGSKKVRKAEEKKEEPKEPKISGSLPQESAGYISAPAYTGSEETLIMFPDSEATEVIGAEGIGAYGYLELTESAVANAIPRIALDFLGDHITIGRTCSDTVRADVQFGREFTKMSRMHARIERNGSEFYIIDLGAPNHTLLDGQVLIPNRPYRLRSGATLTFTVNQPVRYQVVLL